MKRKIGDSEYISSFCLEMALLVHAGISVEDGLYLLAEDERDKKQRETFIKMAKILGEGHPFSTALKETDFFPKYVVDMVWIGEQSGRLEQAFRALSAHYERQMLRIAQIRNALLYPMILTAMMVIIIFVLLIKVLPVFNQVYQQLGGSMNGIPSLLLQVGTMLRNSMPILFGVLGALTLLVIVFSCISEVRAFAFRLYRKIFGDIGVARKIGESHFASALSMGMSSGLHIADAFRTAMIFQNAVNTAKRRYEKCLEMMEQGESLAKCFRENRILESSYCRILELGVKSGTSDTAMEEIARRMDESVKQLIDQKIGRIEPTLVILTSILVGIVLLVVMVPLINIMASIG